MKLLVIANPHAGRGRGAGVLARVEEFLKDRGIAHETAVSTRPGHVGELASAATPSRCSAVVVVGGDGTLFEALNGMMAAVRPSPRPGPCLIPLAQVPVGTGNSFAKDLGIETVEDGLEAIAAGRTRTIDVGLMRSSAGERWFVNLVGAGFVADVAARAGGWRFLGSTSYTIGVLLELITMRPLSCRIVADGKASEREAIFVEICNSRKTGGDMIMAPTAVLDDGLFDVVVAKAMGRLSLLKLFPTIFTGEHVKDPRVETFTCSRIKVEFSEPRRVTPDGELVGETPLSVEVVPKALDVFQHTP